MENSFFMGESPGDSKNWLIILKKPKRVLVRKELQAQAVNHLF